MPDCCLISLTKSGGVLKLEDMLGFFEPWHRVDKPVNKIFYCLEMNQLPLGFDAVLQLPSKAKRKSML